MSVLTALAGGCSNDEPADVAEPSPDAIDAEPAADAAVAVVAVRAEGCGPRTGQGSGAVIGHHLVVTAAHVVAGASSVTVTGRAGTETEAAIVLFDPDLDLAVLRTIEDLGSPVLISDDDPEGGETVSILVARTETSTERPGAVEFDEVLATVRRQAVIATTDIYREQPVRRPGFELEAEVEPGASGALVVEKGTGVGVIWARSNRTDGRAWAVDLPPEITDDEQRVSLADPAAQAPVDPGRCTG